MQSIFCVEGKDTILEVFDEYCTLSSKKKKATEQKL